VSAAYTTTIVCLANSRKPGGRCVAGKALNNKALAGWIRPVSAKPGGEISVSDRQYQNGTEPALLDIIDICMLQQGVHPYQPENHIIDDKYYWVKEGEISYAQALAAVDPVQSDLWGTGYGSSYSGNNDRIPADAAPSFGYSLRLIAVANLRIQVSAEGANFGNMKRKVRGYFTYSRNSYALSVTDPVIETNYLKQADGWHDVGAALLCVSLGEPHTDNNAYKLIAGVILPP
jgi:hypothetical protein